MATKSNHKYRVTIYLGKELYQELDKTSKIMGVSMATICKIVLNTGYELSKVIENNMKGGNITNGEVK